MKKYYVDIERIFKSQVTIKVVANSPSEAKEKAKKELENYSFTEFEEIDTEISDPYED